LTNIQLVPLRRSNKDYRKRRREKSKEENFHLARKKKWKENLKLKVVRKIRGNMVHLMSTGLQQVNLSRKAPLNTQFKNSLMLKLRLRKEKRFKWKIKEEKQVIKGVKAEGSLNIPRKLKSILQFRLRQERRSQLTTKL